MKVLQFYVVPQRRFPQKLAVMMLLTLVLGAGVALYYHNPAFLDRFLAALRAIG